MVASLSEPEAVLLSVAILCATGLFALKITLDLFKH
jgi:hypothetical protein